MATSTTKSKPAARASKPAGYSWNKNEAAMARLISGLVKTFRAQVIAANKLDSRMELNQNWTGLTMPPAAGSAKSRPVTTHKLSAGAGGGGVAPALSR